MVLNPCCFDNVTRAVLTTDLCRIVNRVLSYLKVLCFRSFNNDVWDSLPPTRGDRIQGDYRSESQPEETPVGRVYPGADTAQLGNSSGDCRQAGNRRGAAALVPAGLLQRFDRTDDFAATVRTGSTIANDVQPGPEGTGDGGAGVGGQEAGSQTADHDRGSGVVGVCPICGNHLFVFRDATNPTIVNCTACNADSDVTPNGLRLNTTRPRHMRQAAAKYPPWIGRTVDPFKAPKRKRPTRYRRALR